VIELLDVEQMPRHLRFQKRCGNRCTCRDRCTKRIGHRGSCQFGKRHRAIVRHNERVIAGLDAQLRDGDSQ
jgi:hypothetical protein